MITKSFIEKVHDAFDELNYHETQKLNFDNFQKAAIKTLTHCRNLDDARNTIRIYHYCLKQWNKIEKLFNKKLSDFNYYRFEGNSLISVVSDDEAFGTYYITNGINSKVNEIFVASHSFEEEIFALAADGGKFRVYDDGDYYIKFTKASSKMKLFNNKNSCLCNIVLNNSSEIFLENNITPYDLIVYDGFIGIYERQYIESLADTDIIDTNCLLADIEWDILDKNSDLGVAKLNVYVDTNLEMLLLFATSTFLVYQKFIKSQKIHTFLLLSVLASRWR